MRGPRVKADPGDFPEEIWGRPGLAGETTMWDGNWILQQAIPGDRPWAELAWAPVAGQRLRVSGSLWDLEFEGGTHHGELQREATGETPEADLLCLTGRWAGQVLPALITRDGERLVVCAAPPGEPRPTRFEPRSGSAEFRLEFGPA